MNKIKSIGRIRIFENIGYHVQDMARSRLGADIIMRYSEVLAKTTNSSNIPSINQPIIVIEHIRDKVEDEMSK